VITSLALTGLGVIDTAELELGPGLTVLTGETGAGKTMVVSSLQLLLGSRGSSDMVRSGAERARVTALLDVGDRKDVVTRVVDAGGDLDDDSTLTVVRTVAASGRSRAALGGAPVPIGALTDVGSELVAIHGQHDQSRLVSASHQRELLDRFGDLTDLAGTVATEFERWRSLRSERDDLVAARQEHRREADLLRFGLDEIGAVAPQPGEDAELLAEEERLAHAVELKQAALSVALQLAENDGSVSQQVGELQPLLDAVRAHDPTLDAMASRLADLGYLVSDLASELNSYHSSVEADPTRLAEVQERRAAISALQRKYGPELSTVLAWAADASKRLEVVTGTDDRLAELEAELQQALDCWVRVAGDLSAERAAAAIRLADGVTGELASLAMPDATFEVLITRRGESHASDAVEQVPSATGLDDVTFLLRPHTGAPASPVHRGASGGELSRVMLAIEVVLAGADPVPTVVFDEVDAGVGGSAAVEVGRRLARLGRSRQVLVVTHLPQVAAFADRHWLVEKSTSGGVTASGVRELDQGERVRELTRMLAGLSESSSGQAHAEELLEVARQSS
jgi:DNA repair protein RecN (Recombination protein N)